MSDPRASKQSGEYPRPQLVRDEWTTLDGEWMFAFDDADEGSRHRWWARDASETRFPLTITVPFTFEAPLSGIGDPAIHPVVWYRRSFSIAGGEGERTLLHFGAVDQVATVWVDGQRLGEHRGGQTAFEFDITDALADELEHVLVVRAEDRLSTDVPRGKQEWRSEQHEIWYRRATGIWQSVWLEQVPETHVARLWWQTDASRATVFATILLNRDPSADAEIDVTLTLEGAELARGRVRALDRRVEVQLELPALRNPHETRLLEWSPEHPVLLDADVVLTAPHAPTDAVRSYLGVRSVSVGHRSFLLNRRPVFVRAVLEQGYWPDGLWTAPSVASLRAEVEAILALGFNTVRIHQKIEDPRFLYWCDRLGLMVWGEIGAAYGFSASAIDNFTHEWLESVEQRRSHPSLVVWVPFNESWGVNDLATSARQRDFVRGLTALTRALDETRPVVSNDGWEHVDSDIISIHDYDQNGMTLRARFADSAALADVFAAMGPGEHRVLLDGQPTNRGDGELPVLLSEFGGVAFAAEGTWGYGVATDAASFESAVSALFGAANSAGMLAGYCYTQLTDTAQEANGLLLEDRTPKIPIERIRSMVLGEAPRA